MKRIIPWVISFLLTLVCININQPSALANLVENGSFEEPVAPNGSYIEKQSIPGWQLSNGPSIELQHGVAGTPKDGEQFVELDGNAVSEIYQDIPTEINKAYELTFYFSPRPGVPDNHTIVSWAGNKVAELHINGDSFKDTNWVKHSYIVNSRCPSNRLSFNNLKETSNSVGSYIDKVSVTLAPQWHQQIPMMPGNCENSVQNNNPDTDGDGHNLLKGL